MALKPTPTEKKEDEPAGSPEVDKVKKNAKAESEIDTNEANASELDSVEVDATDIPMAETAEEESIRSFASDWFGKSVLKTTANIK